MNDKQTQQVKQKLLDMRQEILALEDTLKQGSDIVELDQSKVGRLSRMDALQAQEMSLEAARQRQNKLVLIEAALKRIAAGDYGDCFVCGEPIEVARLLFEPTHTRCINCADH